MWFRGMHYNCWGQEDGGEELRIGMNGGVLWGRPRPGRRCSAVDGRMDGWMEGRLVPQDGLCHQVPQTVHSLRHHVAWLLTGQWPLPNRDLYRERSSVPSFKFHYLLFSCRPSSSCWRLLSRLRATSLFCLSLHNVFQKAVPTQEVGPPSLYCT